MPGTERDSRRGARGMLAGLLVLAWTSAGHAGSLPRVDGPLTLDEAVELALVKSVRIKASAADARAMESMRREALGPFWPQLSANGYFNDQSMAPSVWGSAGNTMARNAQVFGADRTWDGNFTAMWPIFSGGRDWYGYQAASRRAEAGREMLRGSEVDVAMQARLDYVAAVRDAENVRVIADLRRDVEERLRVAREAFDAGRIPRYYVLREEAEHANVLQMEAMAASRAEQALIALKTTLGVDLASAISLADRLERAPVSVSVEEGLREAEGGHPEIRAAVRQREAAEAEVRAAYGAYFPQVSVGAMYDWVRMKTGQTETADGYSVGVVVTLPLFDGLMRENAVTTAKAKLDRARHAETLARQQVSRDLSQAALMLAAALRAMEASRSGLAQAEEELRVVRERFQAGRGIQLELLDAQAAQTRARFNVVSALAEYQGALAMWTRGIGRVR